MQNSDDSHSGPDHRDGKGVDPTEATFEDWIGHVADAESVPPEAVRARLMSSYWILDELARHLEDASFDDLPHEIAGEEFTPSASEEETDRIRTILEELVEDARSMDSRQWPDPNQPSWERLVDIVRSLDGLEETDTGAPPAAAEAPDPAHEAEPGRQPAPALHEQLEALQQQIAEHHDEPSNPVDDLDEEFDHLVDRSELEGVEQDLHERLSELEATLEAVGAEIDQLDGALSAQTDDVTDIDQRIGAQSDRIQSLQDTLSTLAEKLEALDGYVETNRDRLGQFESTIDAHADHLQDLDRSVSTHETELENAGKVLRHLFSEVDRLEDRTAVIGGVVRELEPVVAAHHDRQQVDALKETAARIGTRTAECASCEQTVDLGLLTEPACPHCGTPADEITSRSSLLRSKSVLESADSTDEPDREWASELQELDLDRDPTRSSN